MTTKKLRNERVDKILENKGTTLTGARKVDNCHSSRDMEKVHRYVDTVYPTLFLWVPLRKENTSITYFRRNKLFKYWQYNGGILIRKIIRTDIKNIPTH